MSVLDRKISKVPLVYVGGAAVVLVVVAVTLKPTGSKVVPITGDASVGAPVTDGSVPAPTTGDGTLTPDVPTGTVVVAPMATDPTLANPSISSNEEWLSKGVAYLGTSRNVSGGTAQAALQAYLDGASMSYDQGVMRDAVISQYGLPPFVGPIGATGTRPVSPTAPLPPGVPPVPRTPAKPMPPARVQGPLPRTHKVMGPYDNTYAAIAKLYYHKSTPQIIAVLKHDNANRHEPFHVGNEIHVPAFSRSWR
jgi:hypothetical protein